MANSKYVVAMAVSEEGVKLAAINKDELDVCERGLVSGKYVESYHPVGFPKAISLLIDENGRYDGSTLRAVMGGQPIFGNFVVVRTKDDELVDMRLSDILWVLAKVSGNEDELVEAAFHALGFPSLDEFIEGFEEFMKDEKEKTEANK